MASTGSNSSVQETDTTASRADIVVAITSYNDVRTVGAVTQAIRTGLSRYFAQHEVRILLADGGSTDGTRDAAREAAGSGALVEVGYPSPPAPTEIPYHGHPGRAGAIRAVLQTAQRMDAKACAFVDAGLDTVEPDWTERLIAPALNDGYDYVSPYYVRRVDEGAMTKGIVYPMFRVLYGVQVRQPAAGEFGCSARLTAHFLEQPIWDAAQTQAGIDLWLAVAAVCGQFRICEASMGPRHSSRERSSDLSTTLAQIAGALFSDLESRVDVWQRTRGSVPVPLVGAVPALESEPPTVNLDALLESFRLGYRELREIWTWVLPARTIVELRKMSEVSAQTFRFDDRLWASIVYDFAVGYRLHVMAHDHLLRALAPLYTGWLASFVAPLRNATLPEVEQRVEDLCLGFESEKRHLISRWRWPERLR